MSGVCERCRHGDHTRCAVTCRVHGISRCTICLPTPCPRCGGAGIVDTSPPGVETAPWLATDDDCARCDGTGEVDPTTYEPDIEES